MGLFSKDISSIDDLFVETLRDIYYAEQEIVKTLPTMIEKSTNSQLKSGLEDPLGRNRPAFIASILAGTSSPNSLRSLTSISFGAPAGQ